MSGLGKGLFVSMPQPKVSTASLGAGKPIDASQAAVMTDLSNAFAVLVCGKWISVLSGRQMGEDVSFEI